MTVESEVRFVDVAGGGRVAYQLHGEGELDIVYAPGLASHLDLTLEQPRYRRYIEALAQYGRVIRFDRRGAGVSDPLPDTTGEAWETWAEDLAAVLSDASSQRAAIIGTNDAGPVAVLFTASHPELVHALVLFNTTTRFTAADDYPQGHEPDVAELVVGALGDTWGTEASSDFLAPSMAADVQFRRWYARFQRAACAPAAMADTLGRVLQMDVRHALPSVRCPTLVLHRSGYTTLTPAHGIYMAEHVVDGTFEEVPGSDAMIYTEATAEIVERIGRFLGHAPAPVPDRRAMATVLFTDIVGSTDRAVELGDHVWRRLLDDHDATTRAVLHRHGGRLVKSTGDGILATFDAPSRGIRCAIELRSRLGELGIDVRTGLHTGEISVRDDGDIAGVTVHAAARVMAAAPDGGIVVSSSVHDLVTADDLAFTDLGERVLKGIPEPVRLHHVDLAAHDDEGVGSLGQSQPVAEQLGTQ